MYNINKVIRSKIFIAALLAAGSLLPAVSHADSMLPTDTLPNEFVSENLFLRVNLARDDLPHFHSYVAPSAPVFRSNIGSSTVVVPRKRAGIDVPIPRARQNTKVASLKRPTAGMQIRQRQTIARKSSTLFGAHSIRFGRINTATRVSAYFRNEIKPDAGIVELCNARGCAGAQSEIEKISGEADLTFLDKLERVNSFVNSKIEYRLDRQLPGNVDQWALPYETLARGYGDCEDFAILKKDLLAKLGVPKKAMSIIVLKDTEQMLYHAVLAIKTTAGTFILDNAQDKIVKDTEIDHYKPIYSVSTGGNHVFGFVNDAPNQQIASLSLQSISSGASVQ